MEMPDLWEAEWIFLFDRRFELPARCENIVFVGAVLDVIGCHVFRDIELSVLDLSSSRANILGDSSFEGCRTLYGVIPPPGLTSICSRCFAGSSIKEVDLRHTQLMYLGDCAFLSTRDLKRFLVPVTLEEMGRECFAYSGLTELDLAMTRVVELRDGAFQGTTGLEGLRAPLTLGMMGSLRFDGSGVRRLDLSGTGLVEFGKEAFGGARVLQVLLVPATLEGIGSGCFAGTGVRQLDLSGTRVVEFVERAFGGARALEVLLVPPTLDRIGARCFQFSALKRILWSGRHVVAAGAPRVLHEGARRSLGAQCFAHCMLLEQVHLPLRIGSTGEGLFGGHRRLKTVVMGAPEHGAGDVSAKPLESLEFVELHGAGRLAISGKGRGLVPGSVLGFSGTVALCEALARPLSPAD
jgi:hypothetical protein